MDEADAARPCGASARAGGDQDRYRAIFDSAVDFAIIATDVDGLVTGWNTGAARLLGWSAEEMRGKPADRPREEIRQALDAGRASDERWHLRRDGSRLWASDEMMPLRGPDDALPGYLKILRDRTAEHEAGTVRPLDDALRARHTRNGRPRPGPDGPLRSARIGRRTLKGLHLKLPSASAGPIVSTSQATNSRTRGESWRLLG